MGQNTTCLAVLTTAQDYYPFGSMMPGRQISSDGYRYGFQGQGKDDEIKGIGNSINYKYRMHDPRLGRFLSLDPLAPDYSHNSPYAFSVNRVIDGVELEGLEYVTANIYVQNGLVIKIDLVTDYELENENTKGAGFQLNFIYLDKGGNETARFEGTEENGGFVKNYYGLYGGPNNPQLPEVGGEPNEWKDSYVARAVDEADEIFKQHDKDFNRDGLRGEEIVKDPQSTPYNNAVIDRADKLLDAHSFIGSGKRNDIITGEPITNRAAGAAAVAKIVFELEENQKKVNLKSSLVALLISVVYHMPILYFALVGNAASFDNLLKMIGNWNWYTTSLMPGLFVSIYLDIDSVYGAGLSIFFYTILVRFILLRITKLVKSEKQTGSDEPYER